MKHPNPYAPEADLMARAVPCPDEIEGSPHSMLVLRVRSKPWIASAAVHVSLDNQSYLQVADSVPHVVGLRLLETLSFVADEVEHGPLVQVFGPDAGLLRTLSDADWRIGRQPMLIENEWCFVRELVATSKDHYRLHGILRRQFSSKVVEHTPGAEGYLADFRHLIPIRDASVRLGRTLWLKTQPYSSSRGLSLTECPAVECPMPRWTERWVGRGETPLGRCDGTNVRFLLGQVPEPGTLQVFLNGLLLRPGSRGDFRLDSEEIIMATPPPEGSWLNCWYEPIP